MNFILMSLSAPPVRVIIVDCWSYCVASMRCFILNAYGVLVISSLASPSSISVSDAFLS